MSRRGNRLSTAERIVLLVLILATWALRWIALMDVPPGWRDDDLIELYTFSQRIVDEGPVLYFPGASGHEPLYHTLRAPLIALGGINQASARLMSASAGTLVVVLTWALARRLFTRAGRLSPSQHRALSAVPGTWGGVRIVALTAAALVAVSFWSLMYSRVAIRHIGVLPWVLVALYWGWRLLRDADPPRGAATGIVLGTAGALLTYYAGRLTPILLVVAYPLLAPRRGRWRRYFTAVAIGVALSLPMFWTAAHIAGGNARVGELAVPIHALRQGDPMPLLRTAWTTLGMFHAQGDPEWLYNVSGRPIFGPAGAALFALSVAFSIIGWRRPEARLLLIWLAIGISPALISSPPSSFGHTILALPAVYICLASLPRETFPENTFGVSLLRRLLPRKETPKVSARASVWLAAAAAILIVAVVGVRDVTGYFLDWPNHSMVRFLYRADYRALATFLRAQPEIADATVSSRLYGPWDKVAMRTDLDGAAVKLRWADPARALVFANGEPTRIYLQEVGERATEVEALIAHSESADAPEGMQAYRATPPEPPEDAIRTGDDGTPLAGQPFGNALALEAVSWQPPDLPGEPARLVTWWIVTGPLPLPDEELIPNPPPPGVYNGPRLSVFAHMDVAGPTGEEITAIDDGLWVDPYTLVPGDTVLQIHLFDVEVESGAAIDLTLGLYDPLTGDRWSVPSGADHLTIALTE